MARVVIDKSKPPHLRDLQPRQQAFVLEYVVDLNAKAAAGRAGYAPTSASTLMANDAVIDAIEEELERKRRRQIVSTDWVIEGLVETYEQAKRHFDRVNALRALENIGKHLGMFREIREVTGKDGAPMQHEVSGKVTLAPELQAVIDAVYKGGGEDEGKAH